MPKVVNSNGILAKMYLR